MDDERTEKCKKCLSGGESRLGSDEGRRGGCIERIKRMNNAYVSDKEQTKNDQLTDIAVRVTDL